MKKLVLITGVSRGIGRVMAEEFIDRGHTVVGCARSSESVQQLQEQFGSSHQFVILDITDDLGVREWSLAVQQQYDSAVDLLINSAGIINPWSSFLDTQAEVFDRVIDINVKGAANIVRHFLPAMLGQGKGTIVNISSGWGRYTSANVVPFCTSKWAIEGFTKSLSQELPRGVAAVSLWPGSICTDMARLVHPEKADSYISPQEWSKIAIPFLLQIGASDNGKALSIPTG